MRIKVECEWAPCVCARLMDYAITFRASPIYDEQGITTDDVSFIIDATKEQAEAALTRNIALISYHNIDALPNWEEV